MARDDTLTDQVRAALAGVDAIGEVAMFGGIGFMLNGNMIAGASDRGLLVRVGKDREAVALARPGATPMIMRGRALSGYVRVARETLDRRSVADWLRLAREFVETLPAKKPTPARKRPKAAAAKSVEQARPAAHAHARANKRVPAGRGTWVAMSPAVRTSPQRKRLRSKS